MPTRYYKLTDLKRDHVILDGVYAKDIQAYFSGVSTAWNFYAREKTPYKGRYKIEFVSSKKNSPGEDSLSRDALLGMGVFTAPMIRRMCSNYNVGDKVWIRKSEYNAEIGKNNEIEVPAVIIEKYPHHLAIECKGGLRESFPYRDIVLFNAMRKDKSKKVS